MLDQSRGLKMADQRSKLEALSRYLKLSTPPVAVKYFTSFDEELEWKMADAGFYRPKNPINVCQCVGLARHHSRRVLATAEDMACNIGALALGLEPFDEKMGSGEIGIRDGVRGSPELCRELFETLPRIDYGEIKAIACTPLDDIDLDFDQVVFYGTPLEILKIVQAYLWGRGARLGFSTSAKYGVCSEGMANCYKTKEPSPGFPCRGERVSSIVQEQEMFVCVPAEHLGDLIVGLEKTKHLLPTPMPFSGVDQEPTFLPDYYLTENAKAKRDRTRAAS
jgi:uncharacterized protein (DUF169 family)